jgi:hypothetical protein
VELIKVISSWEGEEGREGEHPNFA